MDFFVPGAGPGAAADARYLELASLCHGASVEAEPGRRVYSITYETDRRETWTATVGEKLRGTKSVERQQRGHKVSRDVPIHGDALILAIYAGNPYNVVTDALPLSDRHSDWNNPIYVGEPERVELFAG